jgi:hypothetical protein
VKIIDRANRKAIFSVVILVLMTSSFFATNPAHFIKTLTTIDIATATILLYENSTSRAIFAKNQLEHISLVLIQNFSKCSNVSLIIPFIAAFGAFQELTTLDRNINDPSILTLGTR